MKSELERVVSESVKVGLCAQPFKAIRQMEKGTISFIDFKPSPRMRRGYGTGIISEYFPVNRQMISDEWLPSHQSRVTSHKKQKA